MKDPDPHTRRRSRAREAFARIAQRVSRTSGRPWVFLLACATLVVWALTGPVFGFSDTWQLVINTGTTIVTFLMVFLIQNTQNRDTKAIHLKLDALIAGLKGPSNELIDAEDLTEAELDDLEWHFRKLSEKVRNGARGTDRVPGAAGLLKKFHEEDEPREERHGRRSRA